MIKAKKSVAHVFLLLVLATSAFGQAISLRGVVIDQNGAVVPNAAVTITGTNGFSKTVKTDQNGSYSIAGLTTG